VSSCATPRLHHSGEKTTLDQRLINLPPSGMRVTVRKLPTQGELSGSVSPQARMKLPQLCLLAEELASSERGIRPLEVQEPRDLPKFR